MSDVDETDALLRQTRRLETACGIIQEIHGSLSLEMIVVGIVDNLVELGDFKGAEIAIDATVENRQLRHSARAGVCIASSALTSRASIFIRGLEIGQLTTYADSQDQFEEQQDLLEFILPTLFLGIDHAVSFAEVLDYRATLEQKVADRTAELVQAHEQLTQTIAELKEARAARDRFFANINHEIRTPLTLIQLAVDRIEGSGDPMSDASREKLDDITASTRRLLHLVNSLLMLAAGGEGKLQIRPAQTDIAAGIARLVRNWGTAAERGRIDLSYVGPDTCAACIDETAVETIVGNLVSNAVKFTPARGTITVTLSATDDQLTVTVRDTGPGIEEEFRQRMFGRFERSAVATTSNIRGSGIGLSLTKELVDLQHGTIEAMANEHTPGTTFVVMIPRYQTISAVTQDAQDSRPPARREKRTTRIGSVENRGVQRAEATIVLAEDDPSLAAHMREILAEKYNVLVAPDGEQALELCRKHSPDVLVTDLEMPEMDGIELTRRFLQLQGSALAPVLIVSAHAGLGERLAGFDAGAVDYVVKPFSADELLARIRSQLAIRKLALKLHEVQNLNAMGVLSAGLAHELRNPANAIVNALDPLFGLLPPEERTAGSAGNELYDVMKAAAVQMRELCTNILNVSRSGPITRRPEDVRTLIAKARLVLRAVIGDRTVVESVEIDQPVYCAAPMIEQVLINLIDNAAYAAGIRGTIQINAWDEKSRVVIEVTDSGPGVPAHLHERIFDPFFTTKPVGEGTGLGLALSRRIALNHNGDLRVVRRGQTTAFRLELPRAS
jgi:signal transduction histidine kinase